MTRKNQKDPYKLRTTWGLVKWGLNEARDKTELRESSKRDYRETVDTNRFRGPAFYVIRALRCRWPSDADPEWVLDQVIEAIRKRPERWAKLDSLLPQCTREEFFADLQGSWPKIQRSIDPWRTALTLAPHKFDPKQYRYGYGPGYHKFLNLCLALAEIGELEEKGRVPLPVRAVGRALEVDKNTVGHYIRAAVDHEWLMKDADSGSEGGRRLAATYFVANAEVDDEGYSWPSW